MVRPCFFAVFFALLLPIAGKGQEVYDREAAYRDILRLKEGVLVVRLEGEQRKIAAMEDIMRSAPEDRKPVIERQVDEIRSERDSFNLSLIQAFREKFTFCPVLFIYDHDSREFLDGQRNGIFLNEQGVPDPGIEWPGKGHLGLRSGSAKNGPEGLIMTDDSFRDLPDPFPGFVQRNSIGSFFNWLLARDLYYRKNAERMVEKLDKKLLKFYGSAIVQPVK